MAMGGPMGDPMGGLMGDPMGGPMGDPMGAPPPEANNQQQGVVNPQQGVVNPQQGGGGVPSNVTASGNNDVIIGQIGPQTLSNGGFNNVTFQYNSTTADQLFNEAAGDTINGGVYRGPTDFVTGVDKGLGTSDILKLDINLPIKYNGNLFSDFGSNQSISKANTFAGGGGLEFGLLDLSGNIIAALDRDASGTFNTGDLALDVQDNVTSVAYNASTDVFTFIV